MIRIKAKRRWIQAVATAFATTVLAACARNIEVPASVPSPLLPSLPITVGVYYNDEFRDFLFIEKPLTGPDITVDMGDANVNMFTRMASSVFERSVMVDSPQDVAADVDAVLAPSVDEYALLTPQQAGVNFYSVSIRYRIDLLSPEGDVIDSWKLDSYGRTRSTGITGNNSLAQANEEALRDAAAVLALDLQQRPSVLKLIGSQQ